MNLLCPNCQKMLTVPEQYAGQLMKCPLCAGTFTVPGLPAAPPATPAPVLPTPETYAVKPEAPPTPAAPAPATPPLTTSASTTPGAAIAGTPPPSAPPPPSGPMPFSIWLKPEVIQWIAPAAVVLIFILFLFFPWVGVYPGGQAAAWQYAWQTPFGWSSKEKDMYDVFHFPTQEDVGEGKSAAAYQPGVDLLMLLYIPLLLLTVVVTVACAVLPMLHLKLPPSVEPIIQWRWGIAAVLNLFLFLLLCVQILWGFPIESAVHSYVLSKDKSYQELLKKEGKTTPDELRLKAHEGQAAQWTARTFWLKTVFFVNILAIVAAAIMLGLERRGNRPPAHIDLVL